MIRSLWLSALLGLSSLSFASNLDVAVDAYWQRHPEAQGIEARIIAAEANVALAGRWIGDDPIISLSRLDASDGRATETELDLELPLPSGRKEKQSKAQAEQNAQLAERTLLRLRLAVELLRLNADIRAAFAQRELAQQRLDNAQQLYAQVQARVQAGELSEQDGWLSESDWLSARTLSSDANQLCAELLAQWSQRTGETLALDSSSGDAFYRPTALVNLENFTPVEPTQFNIEEHPAIQLANAKYQASLADAQFQDGKWFNGSSVALTYKLDDDTLLNEQVEYFGLRFSMPLHFGAHRRSEKHEAEAQKRENYSTLQQQLRQLKIQQQRSYTQFQAVEQKAQWILSQQNLAEKQLQLALKAFTLGEQSLSELLRIKASLFTAHALAIDVEKDHLLAYASIVEAQGYLP